MSLCIANHWSHLTHSNVYYLSVQPRILLGFIHVCLFFRLDTAMWEVRILEPGEQHSIATEQTSQCFRHLDAWSTISSKRPASNCISSICYSNSLPVLRSAVVLFGCYSGERREGKGWQPWLKLWCSFWSLHVCKDAPLSARLAKKVTPPLPTTGREKIGDNA